MQKSTQAVVVLALLLIPIRVPAQTNPGAIGLVPSSQEVGISRRYAIAMASPNFVLSMKPFSAEFSPDYKELYYVLQNLDLSTSSGLRVSRGETYPTLFYSPVSNEATVRFKVNVTTSVSMSDSDLVEGRVWRAASTMSDAQVLEVADTIQQRLRESVVPVLNMPAGRRVETVDAKKSEIADIEQKLEALKTLESVQIDSKTMVTEKLKRLREDLQRLEMERAAKRARQRALMEGVETQTHRAKAERDSDDVLKYYQTSVTLKAAKLERMRAIAGNGAFAEADISQAEADLLQAKAQLAVRESEFSKGGKGDLLNRLSDELAMVSVDLTDIELQIGNLQQDLAMHDPTTLSLQNLDRMLAQEPYLRPRDRTAKMPLRDELLQKLDSLYRERFSLKLQDLKVTKYVQVPRDTSPRPTGARGPATSPSPATP